MRFYHLADVHLGAVPDKGRSYSSLREREIWDTFRGILKRARAEQVDCLFICGDLFHRQPLRRELKEVDYLFSRLPDTRIFLMAGNHDCRKPGSAYERFVWSENVTFFAGESVEAVRVEELGLTVYGHSYGKREITEPLYDELLPERTPGMHILMAHGGDAKHIPMDYRRIGNNGFTYVAMGHIHRPGIYEGYPMAYAGALEPLDVNDIGEHGYIEGTIEPAADGSFRTRLAFVPAAKRSYIHLTLSVNEATTAFELEHQALEQMERQGTQNLFKLILKGSRDPQLSILPERLLELGNVAAVEDHTRPAWDYKALKQQYRGQLIGVFLESYGETLTEQEELSRRYGLEALLGESGG